MVKTLRQGFERGAATSLLKYKNSLSTKYACDIEVSFVEHKPNLFGLYTASCCLEHDLFGTAFLSIIPVTEIPVSVFWMASSQLIYLSVVRA